MRGESDVKFSPSTSLNRDERLWCTVQIDGFYTRFGQEVFHCLLILDEASGFCVIEEMLRRPEKEIEAYDSI